MKEIIELLNRQEQGLSKLLGLLDRQFDLIKKKDVFELEAIVDEINECSKEIAEAEIARRKVMGKQKVTQFVEAQNNPELTQAFEKLKTTLKNVQIRKDSNELILKQGISFNMKILSILNPDRRVKTYNSYGNLK